MYVCMNSLITLMGNMLDSFQQAKWFCLRKTDVLGDKTDKVHSDHHTTKLLSPGKKMQSLYFY